MAMSLLVRCVAFSALLATTIAAIAAADGVRRVAAGQRAIERGHYLIEIAGCNDCHAAGSTPTAKLAEAPPDRRADELRNSPAGLAEDDWLRRARAAHRMPQPAAALRALSDTDLRALYRYARHLRTLPPAAAPAAPDRAAVALLAPP